MSIRLGVLLREVESYLDDGDGRLGNRSGLRSVKRHHSNAVDCSTLIACGF